MQPMNNLKAVLILIATVFLAVGASAFDNNDGAQPPRWGALSIPTNGIPTVGATNATVGVAPFAVQSGVLAVQFSLVSTQASTSNVVYKFRTSLDGNRWSTAFISSTTQTLTGTTTNTAILTVGTNIPARYISWDATTSAEVATVFITDAKFAFLPVVGQ